MKIKCKSCGAQYDELEPVCPYCGEFNYIGSTEQYYNKLDDIKDNLSKLPEQQKEDYANTAKSSTKKVGKFLLMALIIIGVVVGSGYYLVVVRNRVDYKDILKWQDQNYPIVDKMYEEGDYDGIVEFMRNISDKDFEKGYSLYDWEHYSFISSYQGLEYSKLVISEYDKTGLLEGDLGFLLYICIEAEYNFQNDEFTAEESIIISDYYSKLYDFLTSTIGIKEAKIKELYEESVGDGFISVQPAFDYGDSIEGDYL